MATIEKFEDLKAWQEARQLARDLYALDVGGKLGALIAYLRSSGMRGSKFKS